MSSVLRFLQCQTMKMTSGIVSWYYGTRYTRACLDENRRSRKNFPKPLLERTYINDWGYVHNRRRSREDQYVVPHNRHLLLLLESHFDVEVSCTVNLIIYLYKYMFKGPDRARYAYYKNNEQYIYYIMILPKPLCDTVTKQTILSTIHHNRLQHMVVLSYCYN